MIIILILLVLLPFFALISYYIEDNFINDGKDEMNFFKWVYFILRISPKKSADVNKPKNDVKSVPIERNDFLHTPIERNDVKSESIEDKISKYRDYVIHQITTHCTHKGLKASNFCDKKIIGSINPDMEFTGKLYLNINNNVLSSSVTHLFKLIDDSPHNVLSRHHDPNIKIINNIIIEFDCDILNNFIYRDYRDLIFFDRNKIEIFHTSNILLDVRDIDFNKMISEYLKKEELEKDLDEDLESIKDILIDIQDSSIAYEYELKENAIKAKFDINKMSISERSCEIFKYISDINSKMVWVTGDYKTNINFDTSDEKKDELIITFVSDKEISQNVICGNKELYLSFCSNKFKSIYSEIRSPFRGYIYDF